MISDFYGILFFPSYDWWGFFGLVPLIASVNLTHIVIYLSILTNMTGGNRIPTKQGYSTPASLDENNLSYTLKILGYIFRKAIVTLCNLSCARYTFKQMECFSFLLRPLFRVFRCLELFHAMWIPIHLNNHNRISNNPSIVLLLHPPPPNSPNIQPLSSFRKSLKSIPIYDKIFSPL